MNEDNDYYFSIAMALDRPEIHLTDRAAQFLEDLLRYFPEKPLSAKQQAWLLDLRERHLYGKGVIL